MGEKMNRRCERLHRNPPRTVADRPYAEAPYALSRGGEEDHAGRTHARATPNRGIPPAGPRAHRQPREYPQVEIREVRALHWRKTVDFGAGADRVNWLKLLTCTLRLKKKT